MHIGKRLFPYPVLNSQAVLNTYQNSKFSFVCELNQEDEYFILDNTHYINTNDNIQNLIDKGMINVVCLVECSSTIYRKSFKITDVPSKIVIPIEYLRDKIVVSCYGYAVEDIPDFYDDDFLDEYKGFRFHIEKYDILAIDDGFTTKIKYDEESSNKVSSIFMIIKDTAIQDEKIIIKETPRKINIFLPEAQFNIYDRTKLAPMFREIYFSFLVIPALTYIIQKFQAVDIDELMMQYDWFASIEKSYEISYNKKLDNESFSKLSSIEFAQELMNFPITKGIDNFFILTTQNVNSGEDDE